MTAPEPALPHTPAYSPPAARPRNEFRFIPPVVAVIITLGLLLAGRADLCRWPDLCGLLTAVDITQGRLDTALPAPGRACGSSKPSSPAATASARSS